MTQIKYLLMTSILFLLTPVHATDIPGTNGIPDLTKGGVLKRINLRWAGPIGIFCGSWRPRGQKTEDVRQLQVLQIEKGSPADGILELDDVILGADGSGAAEVPLFKGAKWAMMPIANAITEAEAQDPAILKLLIWRPEKKASDKQAPRGKVDLRSVAKILKPYTQGKMMTVSIKLQPFGAYADTAPYNCPKSKRILRQGIKTLYESNDPGKFNMGILCLLAADDPSNPDNDKYQARAKEWVHKLIKEKEVGGGAWESGVRLIILSEYYMKTKDETVFLYLSKQAEHHARGVSWFGTTGHRWADKKPDGSPGGRLGGYGPINCSGAQGFLGLSLARKAGVKSPVVNAAIERQRIFFGHTAFKSGIHYGEMPYGLTGGSGDRNGVHAMTGMALGLQPASEEKAKYFVRMTTLASVQNRLYAHGGPFFGQVWQPVAAGQGGVKAANLRLQEIGWHLDLKRRPDGSRIHDPTHQKYGGFSNAATALLFYALPLKQLYITGRGQKESLQFTDDEFKDLLACKNFDVREATDQELIEAFSRFKGLRRGAAASELSERMKKKATSPETAALVDKLLSLAADSKADPGGRAGACNVFQNLKKKAGNKDNAVDLKIVKTMISLLKDPDPYMRFAGVRVLQTFHPSFTQVAVKPYANEIMDVILASARPTFPLNEEDPCQWAHGEICAFLFDTVLSKNLDGVDRKKLIAAMRSALRTPNASARNRASRLLTKLNMEEVRELGAVLVDNIKIPPPANAMGGSAEPQSQLALAQHHFEEGLPLSLIHGGGIAVKNKIPQKYGRAVFSMQSSLEIAKALGKLMIIDTSLDSIKILEEMQKVPAPESMPKLKTIGSIAAADSTLKLPASKTQLQVDARNYALDEEADTTYSWRKVYGAGKVSFSPNNNSQSKKTTVTFTDQKPGKYRFEVTMSDTLGFTVLQKTVDVTLLDKKGELPANKAPQAKSQQLTAVPGLPVKVLLSGTDPDGDDLGYAVIKQPDHGRLSGHGANLTYTANYGFNGMDTFTFELIDGQGKKASGTVQIKVSDKDVGLAVYDGFDYPSGTIIDKANNTSFGFAGPWRKSDDKPAKNSFIVDRGSLDNPKKNPSLSYPSLPSKGGKMIRGERFRNCKRALDPNVLSTHKLLENGHELWFSLFVEPPRPGNNYVSFDFVSGGTKFGFKIHGRDYKIFATLNGKEAGTAHNPWSRSQHLRFDKNGPNMIVGRIVWGKTDTDPDTMEIYRVFDAPKFGPLILKDPVCVLKEAIPQKQISLISIHSEVAVDEIRIGPTQNSVMIGSKPLSKPEK